MLVTGLAAERPRSESTPSRPLSSSGPRVGPAAHPDQPHRRELTASMSSSASTRPRHDRANFGVYGVEKVWRKLSREGIDVGRDRVARLMAAQGLRGVRRGKFKRTTISDDTGVRPADLVDRNFRAPAPTCSGWPTSRMSRPGRGSATRHSSPTRSAAPSSAGECPRRWPALRTATKALRPILPA